MGATTLLLCQSHLERAGISVPAEHIIDGEGFCRRCFAGISPTGTTKPARRPQDDWRRSRRDRLAPRVLAVIAKVFEARAEAISREENSELRGFEEWIPASELAREVEKRENWPWRLTTTRLRWVLSPLGIRPERRPIPGGCLVMSIYRRHFFANVDAAAMQEEPLRTPQEVENAVCELAKEGFNNKEIANKLGIPRKTVKRNLSALYRKTNIEDADPVGRRYRLVARLNGSGASAHPMLLAQSAAD